MTPQLHSSLRAGFHKKLDGVERQVLLMYRVDGLSMGEIARVLGLTEQRVYDIYHGALADMVAVVAELRAAN